MDMTPIKAAQDIVDGLFFLEDLDHLSVKAIVEAIVGALDEYGEKRYRDGFNDGYGASNEEREMAA